MNIIAIDFGKLNSMFCLYDTASLEHSFQAAYDTKTIPWFLSGPRDLLV